MLLYHLYPVIHLRLKYWHDIINLLYLNLYLHIRYYLLFYI
nr:MAG TPA: hypothetical protein [Caudoviricetes sp.]